MNKIAPVSPPSAVADLGTTERRRHTEAYELELTEAAGVFVARAMDTHILDRLARKGEITVQQRDAGLSFFRDYQIAIKESRLCASYNATRAPFSVFSDWDVRTPAEEKIYVRWRKAMRFLRGRLGDLVVSVVCYERPVEHADVRELRCGLTVLVALYGSDKKIDKASARDVGHPSAGNEVGT